MDGAVTIGQARRQQPRQVADHRKTGLRPEDTQWVERDGRLVMRETDAHRRGRWRGAWLTSSFVLVPILLTGVAATLTKSQVAETPSFWNTLVLSGVVPAALVLGLQSLCDPGDQWTLDRAGDAVLQIGQPVAKLSDVRALLVKGEWRRPKYVHKGGSGTREIRYGAPRYEYAVMLETESGERVRIHRYAAENVGPAVAALEAYLGLAAAWKGVPPGADPGAPPDELLDED